MKINNTALSQIALNQAIFRSYDIRGNSLTDLTPLLAYKVGFTFTKITIQDSPNNTIIVGRDGRLSSPALYHALIKGIIDAGGEVISIGVIPTPVLYFADKILTPQGSIMITGSHNPKDDNGFKMLKSGASFYDKQIQDLYEQIKNSAWLLPPEFINIPEVQELDIQDQYIECILQEITIQSQLKVAFDPGNGACGHIIELLTKKLPNKNLVINSKIDGNFPAHHPDPANYANLTELIGLVEKENCDIGIAFDGDGDRLGVISKTGKIITTEQIFCILAKDILASNRGANIIMDIKTSEMIFQQIKLYGGEPIMWKTGHSYIKAKMQETKALFAGEISGHLFFADKYYGYDDGIYAALRLVDLLSRSHKSLDELALELPKTCEPVEIKISTSDDIKFMIIEQLKQQLIKEDMAFNDIDGIRVSSKDGWWLIRASNTEAKIIARYQPATLKALSKLTAELTRVLSLVNISL